MRFHLRKTLIGIASLLLIGTLSYAAHRQVRYWRDGETVFRRCLEVTLDNYVAHNNLAAALVAQRKYEEAKSHYIQALTIHPFYADALRNLGTVLAMQGDFSQAEVYLRKCVEVAPESAEAQGKLGLALAEQGRIQDAVACYRESLRLEPRQMVPCNNLAWILATSPDPQLRNGQEAVQLALRACELTGYNQVMLIGTLAAAYAEAGEFREAVKTAEMAVARAEAEGQTELALKNRQLLEVYRSGKAYHESASAPGQ